MNMMLNSVKKSVPLLISLIGLGLVESGPANPFELKHKNADGTPATDLYSRGSSPHNHVLTDTDEFTAIRDEHTSNFVYAMKHHEDGELVSSGIAVGKSDPTKVGVPKNLRPSSLFDDQRERQLVEGHQFHHRQLGVPTTGTLKNLVILVRFRNHKESNRILPTPEQFDILFNHNGENDQHHYLAPTGSVRDVYRINSYGKLILESTVYGWVDLPETESYYANGTSGFATNQYMEVLHSAMDSLRDNFEIPAFSAFDGDGDGKVDMVTLIHSGYAAEFRGSDVDNATKENRIWSHQRKVLNKNRWYPDPNNKDGDAFVYQYGTASALYGIEGSAIGRIGVICHEIGHALELPDLYGDKGNGLGSYDFMSNHWGFSGKFFQLYPPTLSPWTKIKAGWVEPILITNTGTFTIEASQFKDQIYRINMDPEGIQYLLIENRQPIGFDEFLPQGGLAIWHIDEDASNVEGYPGQEGIIPWPLNGNHYKVALLQADGNYDLERRNNNGDAFDLFHKDGVDFLAPSVNFVDGPYPSTDSYRQMDPERTGIMIHDISKSDQIMTFSVNFMTELYTTFVGGTGAAGQMFDVLPKKDIIVHKLYINLKEERDTKVELWMRTGTHVGYEKKPLSWTRHSVVPVEGNGKGKKSCMNIENLHLYKNTRYSFYLVMIEGTTFRYTKGVGVGSISASNEDLDIFEGAGLTKTFNGVYNERIWNGNFFYHVLPSEGDGNRLLSETNVLERLLGTTFDGGANQDGVMFDILPQHDLVINRLDLHLSDTDEVAIRIYTKDESFSGSENRPGDWNLVTEKYVEGRGGNIATRVVLEDSERILLREDKLQAFYIFVNVGEGLRNTEGKGTGSVVSNDENLEIFEGVGVVSYFGSTVQNRTWNGAFHYHVDNS